MSTVQQKEVRAALRKVGLTKLDDEIVRKCKCCPRLSNADTTMCSLTCWSDLVKASL